MASTKRKHSTEGSTPSDGSDSDVPIVRWKKFRRRGRQVAPVEKQPDAIIETPREVAAADEPKPPAKVNMTTAIDYAQDQAPDDAQPPRELQLSAADLWDESRFNLDYPRLVSPRPVQYAWSAGPGPTTTTATAGGRGPPRRPTPSCLPVAPADDIDKAVSVHPGRRRPGWRWGGGWAAAKLAREVRAYERVKAFWLFEHDGGFLPGFDDKHAFAAAAFAREMGSPWVVRWLAELIGQADVGRILAAGERLSGAAAVGGLDRWAWVGRPGATGPQ